MSQYGAQGYAQHGATYDQILAHFYPGTALGSSPVNRLRVMLSNTATVTISSLADVKVKDGAGTTATLPAGSWKLGPALKLKLPGSDQAQALISPLTFTPTASPLVFKRPYRGTFTITSDGTKLTLVNTLGLEAYLYGVVPSEMPSTWLPEALGAQAVVARSYALAMRKTTGLYDVFGDTRSQAYGGLNAEKPATTEAVDASAGQVLTYGGKVASTYFYSSSGGKTAAIGDVWNTQPVPYLVSVSDPYDTISPYHDWGPVSFTAPQLRKALKLPGRLLDVTTTLNASGRVGEVDATGDQGDVTVGANAVRTALGLRSTWFTVGVLALDPLPTKPVPYGTVVTLTGLGRDLTDLALEQQASGTTAWTAVGPVTPEPDGSVAFPTKATAPVSYRLTSGGKPSGTAKLIVAPVAKLKVPTAPTALSGTVRPALAAAPVQIQRAKAEGGWTTVATTTVDSAGSFSAAFTVAPGTYRARVAAGKGWAVALSAELQVVKT
ncbi:MAG: stage sporulation protein [Gaiellaceae bacterium]|nr:stage sporulation protein [Gaiellaceae bacterium]